MPPAANYYENDFNTYAAGDWTIISTGSNALSSTLGGALLLTTSASAGAQAIELATQSFAFTPGYQTWFSVNVNVTSATSLTSFIIGLVAGTSSVPTSGVYFTKAAASLNVNAVLNKAGSLTTLTSVTTLTISTPISLGIYYDGKPTSSLYFYSSTGLTGATVATPSPTAFGAPPIYGGVRVASASNDGLNPNPLTNLPTVLLSPSVQVATNTTTVATMLLDYMFCACEINRF